MAMTLTGFVFDSSGNAVSGATVQGYVSADNATTTAESATTTDSNGKWSITTSTAARIPMDVKITFGDSVRWLKAGDSINVSKLTLTDTLTVGEDDVGFDVTFHGASAGAAMIYDASEDTLEIRGPSADATTSTGKLLLTTALTDVNANDVLGDITFKAPLEAGGTDAITAAASITAVAQGTFAADLNATDLVFSTGSSGAATEKFRFTSDGELGVGGTNYGSSGDVLTSGGAGSAPSWQTPTTGDITGVAAGVGLSGGGTSGDVTLTLDLSELSGVTPANGDSLATLDSDGSTEQLTTIANLATLFAGTGLTASSSVLSVDDGTASAKGAVIVAGGSGITVSYSSGTATVAGDDASTSAKGVAQFSSDNFAASSGTITIKDGGIVTAELAADAVTGAKIADDAIDSEHYTDGSIDTAHLAADAVTGAKIADDAIDSEHYTDGSIDTAHIADNNVTAAKIFDLARGSILYGNSSAATAELTKGSANTVLTSDGTDISWAAAGGGIGKAVIYRLTSSFTGDADPIASNLEKDDTRGDSTLGDSEALGLSSGVFDFGNTGTGTYLIQAHAFFGSGAADAETNLMIEVATDGSTFEQASTSQGSVYNSSARSMLTASYLFQVTNTTNDKVQFKISGNSSSNTIFGDTNINYTYFTFIKLA
jgi:hypothetical protein